jgi:DNA repair photolyase
MTIEIKRIQCKSLLNQSGIVGIDYAINPYRGCEHGCLYCYARFMARFRNGGGEWGKFVDIKSNALDILRKEYPMKGKGVILLSSVTDPYQPMEKECKLTRGSLEMLEEEGYPIEILTKSDLVLRDIDILGRMEDCEIGMTITTLDDRVRRAFEPRSSSISARLECLKVMKEAGLDTFAFLGPLLPYLSEESLESLLDILADRVNRVIVDRLNIKSGNWRGIQGVIQSLCPDMKSEFKKALSVDSPYYRKLKEKVKVMCRERYIPADILF